MEEVPKKERKKTPRSYENVGRKPIPIDWNQFDKLMQIQCTLEEVASYFNCSIDTIENKCKEQQGMKFSEYFALKRGTGKVSLRRKQLELALSGNPTMLIWLGKQYLEQSEKQTIMASIKKIESEQDIKKLTNEQLLLELEKISKE